MTPIWPVILGLAAGCIGWWATNFFLRPLQRIEELRQRALEEVLFFANVGKDSKDVDRETARNAYRRAASGLLAAAASTSIPVAWWVKRRGWDLQTAGEQLRAMSNSFDQNMQPDGRIIQRETLDQALRFPPFYSKEVVLVARNNLQIPVNPRTGR